MILRNKHRVLQTHMKTQGNIWMQMDTYGDTQTGIDVQAQTLCIPDSGLLLL